MANLRVLLLGRFEVERDGAPVDLGGPLPRRMLLVLAVAEGRTVSIGRLVDEMWDDPGDSAEGTIAAYASRLRKVLEPDRAGGEPSVLRRQGHGLVLAIDPPSSDVDDFRRLAAAGRQALAEGRNAEAFEHLDQALGLWRDDLPPLEDLPVSVRPEAIRLHEERVDVLENRVEAGLRAGRHADLVPELEALAAHHPLRERFGHQLATALYRSGRQPEALAALRGLVSRLDEEHGLEPRPGLRALEHSILTQDPELDLDVVDRGGAGPNSVDGPPAGARRLPVALDPLLGRDEILAEVGALLADRRLVTLTGPAGTGKTRLALALAHAWDGEAVWVPLAEVADASQIAATLAASAGLATVSDRIVADRLAEIYDARPLLVVFDNTEHLSAGAAAVVGALLAAGAEVTVLATSRSSLGIAGEHVVEVEPLSVDVRVPADAVSPAVQLFLDRASTVAPGWRPDDADLASVDSLCRRLDGLPLALELAAARVRDLGPDEILDGLDRWPDLLAGGGSTDPRHSSLAAALGWSDALLGPDDRLVLRRLAVLPGSFDLATATAIAGPAALAAVARLVAGSLLLADRSARPRRYRMLRVVREWAVGSTEADERRSAHQALELWAADLARAAAPHLRHPERAVPWLARFEVERSNLVAALSSGVLEGDPVLALQTAVDLEGAWVGWADQGVRLIRDALAAAGDVADRALLAQGNLVMARLCWASADGRTGLAAAVAAAEMAPDPARALEAGAMGVYMDVLLGQYEEALAESRLVLERAAEVAEPYARGTALASAAAACAANGDLHAAAEHLREVRRLHDEVDDWPFVIGTGILADRVDLAIGDPSEVVASSAATALLSAGLGVELTTVMSAQTTAVALAAAGRHDEAAGIARAVRARAARIGLHLDDADLLDRLAGPDDEPVDLVEALVALRRA